MRPEVTCTYTCTIYIANLDYHYLTAAVLAMLTPLAAEEA